MLNSYLNFIAGGIVASTLLINNSYAASSTIQANSMPSCTAYRDMVACNTSKSNKGKGSQCMFLFPNNERSAGERSGAVTCQAISDAETVNFFKRINIKEIVDLYPDLYEYDESSNIGNPNHPNFHNNKRHTMVGGFVQGSMMSSLTLKRYHELCVAKNDEETCNRAIFERNKDFIIRDAENEDTNWEAKHTAAVEWDKLSEDIRQKLIADELARKERDVTKTLMEIKKNYLASIKGAAAAKAKQREEALNAALNKEKEDGSAERYDEQCKGNKSGDACRRVALRTGGTLIDVNCTWLHKSGMMGGGTCRYANAITCEELISKDCGANSSVLAELASAKVPLRCELSGSTCATAAG